jgi:phosphoserine aminotransferase
VTGVTSPSAGPSNGRPPVSIPPDLLPSDGRFGSGPSKVRTEAVEALLAVAPRYLGTSHRRAPVRDQVGRLRHGLSVLFGLPDRWEIVLGNGGTTSFWDAALFSLVERRSQHLVFGEFSGKFAAAAAEAPFLDAPEIIESEPGTHPWPKAQDGIDTYALTHNETSTGVSMPLRRPEGADGLVIVDATSAAGALRWDPAEVDVYEFAPQKVLASDGGLWLAACSPAAIERIERLSGGDRWIPASLDLRIAVENSRLDQTYNTPALATVFLAAEQVDWILANGGLSWAEGRCELSSSTLYQWAETSDFATPFVTDPAMRSKVVCTIDLVDDLDAEAVAATLRANGIVDTESYRKLGRNQLRIAAFPSIDPEDMAALCACLDYVAQQIPAVRRRD